MPVERELPAKIGWCYKNLAGRNFDLRSKSSRKNFFISKHLKGRLGPRVSNVTFFNHGGQLGFRVGNVTSFNHEGRLGPRISNVSMTV